MNRKDGVQAKTMELRWVPEIVPCDCPRCRPVPPIFLMLPNENWQSAHARLEADRKHKQEQALRSRPFCRRAAVTATRGDEAKEAMEGYGHMLRDARQAANEGFAYALKCLAGFALIGVFALAFLGRVSVSW